MIRTGASVCIPRSAWRTQSEANHRCPSSRGKSQHGARVAAPDHLLIQKIAISWPLVDATCVAASASRWPVRQAAGAWPLHSAICGGSTAWLVARRHMPCPSCQSKLQLADLEEDAAEAEAATEKITVPAFERRKPARRPMPAPLPRERIIYPAPSACPCCGDSRLRKIGEDVTETLELIPRQWKVIQHVREKFSCRACKSITQTRAPSHPIARGRAGPKLLAHVLFAKYGLHLPLNRQSEVYAREGIDLVLWPLTAMISEC